MGPKQKQNDLTPYELERLENIRRNEEFMKVLGIAKPIQQKQEPKKHRDELSERKRKISEAEMSSTKMKHVESTEPLRRSGRLSACQVVVADVAPPLDDEPRGYADMPFESNDLDDFEFKVFVILRAWRLKTCRALEIEAYKIFQNRTLCEFVRRRRNNSTWGTTTFDPAQSVVHVLSPVLTDTSTGEGGEKEAVVVVDKRTYSVADQLMMCWGVGPSKVREDEERPGFAFGALMVLDASPEVENEESEGSDSGDGDGDGDGNESKRASIAELLQMSRDIISCGHD